MVGVLLSSGLEWGQDMAHAPRWQGVALACAAALLYAISTLATQRLKHLPSAQIAAVQMGFGVIVLAPLALPIDTPLTPQGMAALATAGLVHTAFMYTLMYAAFQRLPSQTIAMRSPDSGNAIESSLWSRLRPMFVSPAKRTRALSSGNEVLTSDNSSSPRCIDSTAASDHPLRDVPTANRSRFVGLR